MAVHKRNAGAAVLVQLKHSWSVVYAYPPGGHVF